MYMNMNLNYSKKQQPVKLRGQPNDINQYIQTLKQKISVLENKVSELSKANQELTSENVTLKDNLDYIHKEKEGEHWKHSKYKMPSANNVPKKYVLI